MLRRSDRAGFDGFLALCDYPVGGFFHHLLQQHSQMGVRPVVRGRNVFDAIGMG
jgi:hypothetical protein